jgi:putative Holliday junction resolvase
MSLSAVSQEFIGEASASRLKAVWLRPPHVGSYDSGMRVVGVDFGERRIGLAVSDRTGTLASPFRTIDRRGLDLDPVTLIVNALEELAHDDPVERIIVGLPRRLDGSDNDQTSRVRQLAIDLAGRTGLPVDLQDERLSSREAEERLAVRQRDWRKRKDRLDAAAAAVLLQDWLDGRKVESGK